MSVMIVNQIRPLSIDKSSPFSITEYLGLSTDVKPTDCNKGSTFEESDSGDVYKFNGSDWNLSARSSIIIKGISESGTNSIVTDNSGHLISLEYVHAAVHEGIVNTIAYTFLNVGVDGYAVVRLKTLNKALHFEINFNSDLKSRIKTYSSPTILTNGTLIPSFNRIIDYVDVNKEFEVYINSTFTGGTLRGNDFIGSNTGQGSGAVRAGGGKSGGIESILLPNQDFIIQFQNVGSATSDIGFVINCYEKPYTV